MTNKKRNIPQKKVNQPIILEMSNYNSPNITEIKQKNWVKYGEDNNYFQYLLDRFRGSPTNNAIITGIVDAVVGKGLTSAYQRQKPEEFAKAALLFNYNNVNKWAFDLKCFGFYAMVVVRNKALNDIAAVDYTPIQNWRSGIADENGEVKEYWYSDDWTQITKKQYKPVSYPAFDPDKKDATSIFIVKPHKSGTFYYPSVDYQGALQYAHIEEEISNFHLNNIMNNFVPSVLINFNNGHPGEEEARKIEQNIIKKYTGSSQAGKVIVSFNDDKERAATVETLAVSDLDKQYQFLSEESQKKIMVGHRVTSPLFFGIRDSSGLGSNADEIKNAWLLYENTVLRPFRKILTESFEYLLSQFNHFIQLEFVSNTPIEFKEEEQEQQTSMCSHLSEHNHLESWMSENGEEIDSEEWELVDERMVDYDMEQELDIRVDLAAKVISGDSRPISEQDNKLFKIRYSYEPKTTSENSREFCTKMTNSPKVFRKEDIVRAGDVAVNPGWGANGADTYSIWLYKGGGDCHHYWMRQTYLRRNNQKISVNQARRLINALPPEERDDVRLPVNEPEVAKRPTDLPNNGFLKPRGGN